MSLEVTMTLERHYVIRAKDGVVRARVVSEWEGFTKLVTERGDKMIVQMPIGIAAELDNAMGKPHTAYVISAAPGLIEILVPKARAVG